VQPPRQDLTHEQASEVRRKHWPNQQWSDLISSVVDEVFGTMDADEGSTNPLRLNSANRTRWLCEQTMRSNKRIDDIIEQQKAMMQKMDEQQDLKAKVDEMMAQQMATMEKLDALLARAR
jgi:hypothetical protein